MSTIYYTATTLDGFIATDDHSLAWLLSRTSAEDGPLDYPAFIAGVGALCMGANTYRWLQRELGPGEPWPYSQPTWVFSHSGVDPWPGADVRMARGDVAKVHEELVAAAEGRAVWVVGGGDLAGQFLDHDLLDEVVVNIAPVTLGSGRPLLPRHAELRCLQTQVSGEFVAIRYQVVRPAQTT